jgi:Uma2 family endonuclease
MTHPSAEPYVTFEDFVAAEQDSETKHEWLDGVVYAMGGGTLEHSRLAGRMTAILSSKLAGRCTILTSDAMVYVRETDFATYPDASVVCGAMDVQRVLRNKKVIGEALTNPTILVEVLSESTESYDRGEKFAHYMRLASLREYVLVSQGEPYVEVFRRDGDEWVLRTAMAGQMLELTSQGIQIAVDAIYADPRKP